MITPPDPEISVARFGAQILGVVTIAVIAVLVAQAAGLDPWKDESTADAAWFDQTAAVDQRNWLDSDADLTSVSDVTGAELARTVVNVELTDQFRGQNLYRFEWKSTGIAKSEARRVCQATAAELGDSAARCTSFPEQIRFADSPGPIELIFEYDEAAETVTLGYEPS